jgi:hypothetical protein
MENLESHPFHRNFNDVKANSFLHSACEQRSRRQLLSMSQVIIDVIFGRSDRANIHDVERRVHTLGPSAGREIRRLGGSVGNFHLTRRVVHPFAGPHILQCCE